MLSHVQQHHKQQPQLQKKFILIPLCLIWKRMRMRSSSPRPKRNAQRAHYLVLSKCTKIPKIKPNRITGWSQASTAFDVPDIVKLIKSNIFKFEYVKYLPILIHQSKMNFNTPHRGNMTDSDYSGEIYQPGGHGICIRGVKIHDRDIFDIVAEEKHTGARYDILDA